MIYAEILAGGKGTRMGNTQLPKQFLEVCGKPVIIHTIMVFAKCADIDKIIVVCPEEWISYTQELINKNKICDMKPVYVVSGGADRADSCMNGCLFIKNKFGITSEDILVTHDAVRPFVTEKMIAENIEAAQKYDAAGTAIPSTDTLLHSYDRSQVDDVPDRSEMYLAQTPQTFKLGTYISIYESLSEPERRILTDGCRIFTTKGLKVKIVQGDVQNIKITTKFDMEIANVILKDRSK